MYLLITKKKKNKNQKLYVYIYVVFFFEIATDVRILLSIHHLAHIVKKIKCIGEVYCNKKQMFVKYFLLTITNSRSINNISIY